MLISRNGRGWRNQSQESKLCSPDPQQWQALLVSTIILLFFFHTVQTKCLKCNGMICSAFCWFWSATYSHRPGILLRSVCSPHCWSYSHPSRHLQWCPKILQYSWQKWKNSRKKQIEREDDSFGSRHWVCYIVNIHFNTYENTLLAKEVPKPPNILFHSIWEKWIWFCLFFLSEFPWVLCLLEYRNMFSTT